MTDGVGMMDESKTLDLNGKMSMLSKPFVTLSSLTHLGPGKGKGV